MTLQHYGHCPRSSSAAGPQGGTLCHARPCTPSVFVPFCIMEHRTNTSRQPSALCTSSHRVNQAQGSVLMQWQCHLYGKVTFWHLTLEEPHIHCWMFPSNAGLLLQGFS